MAKPYYVYGGNLLSKEKYTSVVNTPYGEKRYFSSIDTDIYFGDTLIDEMVAFDFMIEEKKIPIYGYNNFTPKRIITGQKVIQGSFAINFTQTFNLTRILAGLPESIYASEYEETQFYCGDDNKALFDKGFDITISYGDAKTEGSYNACTQTLVGVHITSYRQAFDTSGEPILDMYTFIAKDLLLNSEMEGASEDVIDETVTDNGTTKEATSSEKEIVANTMIDKECDELYSYCKEHPETLGLFITPTYNYVNGVSRLELYMLPYNNINLTASEIIIEITDIALTTGGTKSFKLDKKTDSYNYYCEMKGTNANTGKEIKKLFGNGEDYLDCVVYIKCKGPKESYDIEHVTRLYCNEYSYLG